MVMKKILKYKWIILIAVSLLASSCKKFLDINTNPVNPQEPKAEFLMAPIIFQMANGTSQDYRVLFKITQNWGNQEASDVWERHTFAASSDVGGVIWRMTYVNLGLNLEEMIKDGLAKQKYEFVGIGYAIKAWAYQITTDYHGPIILDEAFKPNTLFYKYQDQPEVYAKVREWSNLAIKYLNMESPTNQSTFLRGVTGDGIYGGDMSKWKKFVYANLALQYSHLVNKSKFVTHYADSVIKYTDLSFASTAEDPTIFFTASNSSDGNPFGAQYSIITSTAYGRIGQPIVDLLTGGVRGTATPDATSSIDPRLTRMIVPIAGTSGIYRGKVAGKANSTYNAPHALGTLPSGAGATYPGWYIFADKARYPLMSYAQLQFAKAEAYFLKGDKTSAYTAYINAIRAHMDFTNTYGRSSQSPAPVISATEISAYLASSEVAQNANDLTIADIMQQKYIAQWGWAGVEQWCDLRKYHYSPSIFRTYYQMSSTELASANNGNYAYRIRPRYNSEYIWNEAELNRWGALAADYMTKETWFSKPGE